MPTSVARNAAQVVIVPNFKNRISIFGSGTANSSSVTPTDGKVLLPWISGDSQNAAGKGVPLFVSPSFVTQPNANGALVFTGPGYVNYYLATSQDSNDGGTTFLRIVGAVFKNSASGSGSNTNQALYNMPVSQISLIPNEDPALQNLNTQAANYFLFNKNTDPFSGIVKSSTGSAIWTPPAADSGYGTPPQAPIEVSTGIQIYNAFTNLGNASPWTPEWDFYIIFQWGDGMVSMIDPDDENQPNIES